MSLAQLIFVNSAAFKRSNSHSTETKKQLIELLAEGLLKVYTNTPCEKKLVITSQSECPVQVHLGIKTLRHGMSTTDEEADVITPQQVITAIEEGATCVKFISDDTDVFVLLLHFYIEQSLSATVFFEETGSNRNVTDIRKTAEKQKDVVPSLLAAHSLSGCDSMPKLYGFCPCCKNTRCNIWEKQVLMLFKKGKRLMLLTMASPTQQICQKSGAFFKLCQDILQLIAV